MAPKSVRSFRKAIVGGFSKKDVVDFLHSSAKERNEEIEAYRAGAEKLREERDHFKQLATSTTSLQSENSHIQSEISKMQQDNVRMQGELSQLKELINNRDARIAELAGEVIAVKSRSVELTEENDRLRSIANEVENELSQYAEFRGKLAEAEAVAYNRAEKIEQEARQNADNARAEMIHSIGEIKNRIDLIKSDALSVTYKTLRELDAVRGVLTAFPETFNIIERQFSEIIGDNKPIIRQFVPERFDD